jgi:hypothetical protein
MPDSKIIRRRAWHFLSPEVAAAAGLQLDQLQQFVAGRFHPTDEQVMRLAERMRLTDAR